MQTTTVRRQRAYVPTGDVGRHLAAAQRLQEQLQEIEAQLSTHREWLLEHMNRTDLHRIESGDFCVVRKVRHKWTYSPETEREALKLRTTQRWEQTTGQAVDNPTVYISMSSITPKP